MTEGQMMEALESATAGDVVAHDYRAAAVFERFGIDFCCGGRRSVADACRSVAADPAEVIGALDTLADDSVADEVSDWPLDRIIDRIISTHHTYVRQALPSIARHIGKLTEVHGQRHPELAHVASLWHDVYEELAHHMAKEEQILFPYIRVLVALEQQPGRPLSSPFGTVENPIRMMEREHRDTADALHSIRAVTNDYTAPADGCATYRVCMAELAEFERDLHRHVHLENNILFPRAIVLEQRPWRDDRG